MTRRITSIIVFIFMMIGASVYSLAQTPEIDSLIHQADIAPNDSIRMEYFLDLSIAFRDRDPKESRKYAQEALAIAEGIDFLRGIGNGHYFIGISYYYESKWDTAIASFEAAKVAFESYGDSLRLSLPMELIAVVHQRQGNSPLALESYFEVLKLLERINDPEGQLSILINISSLFSNHLENYERALVHLQRAESIYENTPDTEKASLIRFLPNTYSNMGICYSHLEDLDLAESYQIKALNISKELDNLLQASFANNNLGSIAQERKQFEKALAYYQEAQKGFDEVDYTYGRVVSFINVGSAMGELGQFEEGNAMLKKGLDMAIENQQKPQIRSAYQYLANNYKLEGKYQQAFEMLEQFNVINDSLLAEEGREQLSEMEVKYEAEKKDAEIARKELERQKERQGKIWAIVVAGGILLMGIIGFLLFYVQQQNRKRQTLMALRLKRVEANNLRQLDQLKSRFFANISHEFRTPLTLILGLAQQLKKAIPAGPENKSLAQISHNGLRLLDLIQQLLDLSRLEAGRMQLTLSNGNLLGFISGIAHSFHSLADNKEILYQIEIPTTPLPASFDPDKLQKILSNLLSNAFKFTQEEGKVRFAVMPKEDHLEIIVEDSGIGIPEEHLDHIFDRFYRVEGSTMQGAGIGLALTKELVQLHEGKIVAVSEVNKGTSFWVRLPFWPIDHALAEMEARQENPIPSSPPTPSHTSTLFDSTEKPTILVVEDHEEVRHFIKDQLTSNYTILEAANGAIGLTEAKAHQPDLIITDVMMPEMDGHDLTQALKTDALTSHIPVIMLTAKGDRDSKLEGLDTGADDYLTKPFDQDELLVRINNLIKQRALLREKFSGDGVLRPKAVSVTSVDETFLNKVMEVVETHIQDEHFSIEALAAAVNLSRSQLHKKLKALTDMSPSVFVRTMRLHRAKSFLEQKAGTAAEISYLVGFSSPAYFSKCFKDEFGVSPGEV